MKKKVYLGLTCPPLDFESLDLGNQAYLVKTYASLFAPFMLSFTRPTASKRYGEPWKAANGGLNFVINAQAEFEILAKSKLTEDEQISHFVALLRISISPEILCPFISNGPFLNAEDAVKADVTFYPYETESIYTRFTNAESKKVTESKSVWMRENWHSSMLFAGENKQYKLAVEILGKVQHFHSRGMALVAICGVLESFYLQNRSELSFRLALFIAAYLGNTGKDRISYFNTAKKVYAARSASAHSSEDCPVEPLLDAIHLLRLTVWAALSNKKLPKVEDLDVLLLNPQFDQF
ncbi:hypothetical protein GCM10023213_23140 [Prosthecobacter algae]|uniref:Apea-like HEPN domain-containing protein n=1 Tax=Prosthecobacter algae TaxID=1144682 RepID=A0ABP9P4I9_9BACT